MIRLIAVAVSAILLLSSVVSASERQRLGYGVLVTNDLLGDGRDRWRSGSVASSRVWGPEWTGQLPDNIGEILELRFNAEIIAPRNLNVPAAGDRPFAGAISLGLHTHFQTNQIEFAVGGDLVFTGPQTGLDDLQSFLHDQIGSGKLSSATRNAQVGNDINPTLVAEAGHSIEFGKTARLRPFVEGRAGVETMARVGADLIFGHVGHKELLVRDPVTGHRYRAITNGLPGYSFIVGGDMAYVDSSEFLPSNQGLKLSDARSRARAGVHWNGNSGLGAFYGLTWLDKEFKGQADDQIVGSVRLRIDF